METLPKIKDGVIKMVQGGVSISDSKLSAGHIYQLIHEARAAAIKTLFEKERRIQSTWTQDYYGEYEKELQDDTECSVKFSIPAPLALNNKADGILYVGSVNGLCAYRKVVSRAELSNLNRHRITKVKDISVGGNIKYLYTEGIIELYGDKNIKNIKTNLIAANPTLLPTYNIEESPYPIDNYSLGLVKQGVAAILMGEINKRADKKQDFKDNEIA